MSQKYIGKQILKILFKRAQKNILSSPLHVNFFLWGGGRNQVLQRDLSVMVIWLWFSELLSNFLCTCSFIMKPFITYKVLIFLITFYQQIFTFFNLTFCDLVSYNLERKMDSQNYSLNTVVSLKNIIHRLNEKNYRYFFQK